MVARWLTVAVTAALCTLGGCAIFLDGVAFASTAAPQIERVWAASVGVTGATLHATITPDPETLPETASDTVYRFEYGTDASYGSSVPTPDAAIAASTGGVEVSQPLSGLQAETIYHYRVVAVNPSGETVGQGKSFTTYANPTSTDSCPNALTRGAQFSAYLPDCRAYELVSPPYDIKEGANIATTPFQTQSSTDGNAIKYFSRGGFGDVIGGESLSGAEYVARRGSEGWDTHSITPEQGSRRSEIRAVTRYEALSPDLSKGVFLGFTPVLTGHPNVESVNSLYLRSDVLNGGPGGYELLNDAVSPVAPVLRSKFEAAAPAEIWFAAASADWTHILFESTYNLTSDAAGLNPERPKAYEWDKGVVRLVGILPDGTPAEDSLPGDGVATLRGAPISDYVENEPNNEVNGSLATHAISDDGSRAIFTGPPLGFFNERNAWKMVGNLYMRIDHSSTIQLNVSERSAGVDPNAPLSVSFSAATPDDSKVFFLTRQALTDDAPVNPTSYKLYMYDTDKPEGHHLTLISVDSEPSDPGTDLAVGVVGLSSDASYVYFTSGNDLLPNLPPHIFGDTHSLYVWHNGAVRYVGSAWRSQTWGGWPLAEGNTFRTSPDGRNITFMSADPSTAERTGYDNADPRGTCNWDEVQDEYCYEVYEYNVDRDELQCASCSSSGVPPQGDALYVEIAETPRLQTQYLNHPMSGDGRFVFFDTPQALVPQDTDGHSDVYEYDTLTHKQFLLSPGTCSCDSYFTDASPDGRDVFFTTHQRLVYADTDTGTDLYDARIEGGIPAQNRPPAVPCSGEECQGPVPSAPVFSLPASSTFAGIGNPPVSASKPAVKRVKHKATHRKQHRRKGRHKGKKSNRHASRRAGR